MSGTAEFKIKNDLFQHHSLTNSNLLTAKDHIEKGHNSSVQKSPLKHENSFYQGHQKCSQLDCPRPLYKNGHCKHHLSKAVLNTLRKEMRNTYRGPEKAYASMDFTGKGMILEEEFISSLIMTKIPFNKEDIKEFIKQYNLFQPNVEGVSGITFDQFKKMFFPQYYLVNDEVESDEDRKLKKSQIELRKNQEKQPELIAERLKKLEKILKDKFSNNWESVRKAFLALDSDYDGYITVEDILRYFGQEKDLNYNDLKKLIKDKDSKKQGKIGYTDFSKWVGNSIHQSEGFYFRHDSIKNPQFDKNLQKHEAYLEKTQKKIAQEQYVNDAQLEKAVLDKIQFQWKTLRKAFMDLNMEKTGAILPDELRFYFKHWGMNLNDAQFKYLFDKFDLDKDGKISYKDFQLTVGSEIHPGEGLYFRQDKPYMQKINSCKHDKCWQGTQGNALYCQLHQKMHQDQSIQLFGRFFKHIGHKWRKFIMLLKKNADPDDQDQLFFDNFSGILKKFGITLSEEEKENLVESFPGRDEGQRKRINVSRLYDQKYNMLLSKMYQKVDVHEDDGKDDPVDEAGYLGQFYREKRVLRAITEEEFIDILLQNNKLAEIIRTIKEIDRQHNGFVTSTELDDILKLIYKQELGDRDLKPMLKKYASIQNRILIDYKQFRDAIVKQLKQKNGGKNITLGTTLHSSFLASPDPASKKNAPTLNGIFENPNNPFQNESTNKQQESSRIKQQYQNRSTLRTPSKGSQPRVMDQSFKKEETMLQLKDMLRPKTRDIVKSKKGVDYVNRRKLFGQEISGLYNNESLMYNSAVNRDISRNLNDSQLNQSPRYLTLKNKKMSTIEQGVKGGGRNPILDYSDTLNNKMSLLNENKSLSMEKISKSFMGNNLLSKMRKRKSVQQQYNQSNFRSINASSTRMEEPKLMMNMEELQTLIKNRGQSSMNQYPQQQLQQKKTLQETFKSLYQTLGEINPGQKFKDTLKQKLCYEWKSIYRMLSQLDFKGNGFVTRSDFEQYTHQCGVYLTREDVNKIAELYGSSNNGESLINYKQLSMELGLHQTSFSFMKNNKSRIENIQRLRTLYSSNEKQKPSAVFKDGKWMNSSVLASAKETSQENIRESTTQEIKETLMKKIKEFRDLIHIFQRKNHQENSILPVAEFKAVLRGIGLNMSNQQLQRFMINNNAINRRMQLNKQTIAGERAKSSQIGGQSFFTLNGVRDSGIDAKEFLKFYI